MPSGKALADQLASLSGRERDSRIWYWVEEGYVPDYLAKSHWKWVSVTDAKHTLRYLVAPDYFAVGTDSDPFRVATQPSRAQQIADKFYAILPTRQMIRQIQSAASPKINFLDVKASPWNVPVSKIHTHAAWVAANNAINRKLDDLGIAEGDHLIIGYRKAIVLGPKLDGSRVAIFGGRGGTFDGGMIQPYSTIHSADYVDPTHGIVLVSRRAVLDGEEIDIKRVLNDPKLSTLLSDQGPMPARFPNAALPAGEGLKGSAPGVPAPKPKPGTKPTPKPAEKSTRAVPGALGGAGLGFLIGGPIGGAIGGIAGYAIGRRVEVGLGVVPGVPFL
jgi:hypothetical protein